MPRSIRILRIIDRLNVGGPAQHVSLLTSRLEDMGYKTILVKGSVAPGEIEMRDVIVETGIRPVSVPTLGRALSWQDDLKSLVFLYRTIRRFRPDIVHTHKSKAGLLGRLAALLAGVPGIVHTFHGNVFHGYFGRIKSRLVVLVERLLGGVTDRIVTLSPKQRIEILSYRIASPDRVKSIPLGLVLDRFRRCDGLGGDFRAELGAPGDISLVGLVGRLVPIKGVHVFLKAAANLLTRFPRVCFVVVGDGERREALESEARSLGIEGSVRFMGYRRDTDRIYASLDLFVLSSYNEGLPVTIIEALTAGCYVVATNVGGVSDLITNERVGMIVEPGNPESLSEAMGRALSEHRIPPESDRDVMCRRYGIDRLTADLDCLYRGLVFKRNA